MKTDNERFKYPATAREFIRNMAFLFEDPEDMLAFLNACDIAQAALACWLFEENRYKRIQILYARGKQDRFLKENQVEINIVWHEYCQATSEFNQAKLNLKEIVSKLDKTDDRKLSENRCNK